MDSLSDLLHSKAGQLDKAGTSDDMDILAAEMQRMFGPGISIDKLNDGEAVVRTNSSSLASNIRLQQYQLLQSVNKALKTPIKKLRVRIR